MHKQLSGRWYLNYTNFAMWKHGKISDVTFNYEPAERNGKTGLRDTVEYVQKGRSKSIAGFDFINANNPGSFIWQGDGWMFWIKCPWQIEWINDAKTCIVLSFEKTLLTAGGVDVITREKAPDQQIPEEAFAFIKGNAALHKRAQSMVRVLQN